MKGELEVVMKYEGDVDYSKVAANHQKPQLLSLRDFLSLTPSLLREMGIYAELQ